MRTALLVLVHTLALLGIATEIVNALSYASIHDAPCPEGWNHDPADDTCSSMFPRQNHNYTLGVKSTYEDAAAFCARQNAEMPIIYNLTKLRYYNDLAGHKSGKSWWIGVRHDRTQKDIPQRWLTRQFRPETFEFDWDPVTVHGTKRQPGQQHCVVQYMRGDGKKVHGGRTKMVTRDCWERHHVICTKPRVPPKITALMEVNYNQKNDHPRRVEAIWSHENTFQFWGQHIPQGTILTMQTTSEEEFATGPHQPTDCKHIGVLHGASEPIRLNITTRNIFNAHLCNGTCQTAEVTFPASWPFVRGAKYSFCFFVPTPGWPTPIVKTEYDHQLLGPDAQLEIVQKHEEYLRDVCLRRQQNLDMFYGSGHIDTHRGMVNPFYFESHVERGLGGKGS